LLLIYIDTKSFIEPVHARVEVGETVYFTCMTKFRAIWTFEDTKGIPENAEVIKDRITEYSNLRIDDVHINNSGRYVCTATTLTPDEMMKQSVSTLINPYKNIKFIFQATAELEVIGEFFTLLLFFIVAAHTPRLDYHTINNCKHH